MNKTTNSMSSLIYACRSAILPVSLPPPKVFSCSIPSSYSSNCSRDLGLSLEQQGLLDHSIWAWNPKVEFVL